MQGSDEPQADLKRAQAAMLGQSLDGLSVTDLHAYIASLQSEIRRVEAAVAARHGVRSAAEAIFGNRAES